MLDSRVVVKAKPSHQPHSRLVAVVRFVLFQLKVPKSKGITAKGNAATGNAATKNVATEKVKNGPKGRGAQKDERSKKKAHGKKVAPVL